MAKGTGCSSRGSVFDSQNPDGSSQPSVTSQFQGIQCSFLDSIGTRHAWFIQTYM